MTQTEQPQLSKRTDLFGSFKPHSLFRSSPALAVAATRRQVLRISMYRTP